MFRTGSFILRLLLALLLLAGLFGAGAWAFHAGYSQGFVAGATSEGKEIQFGPGYSFHPGMMPYAPFGRMHFFPPIGSLFCGGLLFLALLALIFRPRHWRHHPAWTHGGPHHWAHEHCHEPEHAHEAPSHTDKPEEKA